MEKLFYLRYDEKKSRVLLELDQSLINCFALNEVQSVAELDYHRHDWFILLFSHWYPGDMIMVNHLLSLANTYPNIHFGFKACTHRAQMLLFSLHFLGQQAQVPPSPFYLYFKNGKMKFIQCGGALTQQQLQQVLAGAT